MCSIISELVFANNKIKSLFFPGLGQYSMGYKERAKSFQERRDFVVNALNAIEGIECLNPDGAFYVFPSCKSLIGKRDGKGKEIKKDTDFVQSLLENNGIAVVQGSAFGLEAFFRISYATSMENLKKALEKISSFCKILTISTVHAWFIKFLMI